MIWCHSKFLRHDCLMLMCEFICRLSLFCWSQVLILIWGISEDRWGCYYYYSILILFHFGCQSENSITISLPESLNCWVCIFFFFIYVVIVTQVFPPSKSWLWITTLLSLEGTMEKLIRNVRSGCQWKSWFTSNKT